MSETGCLVGDTLHIRHTQMAPTIRICLFNTQQTHSTSFCVETSRHMSNIIIINTVMLNKELLGLLSMKSGRGLERI